MTAFPTTEKDYSDTDDWADPSTEPVPFPVPGDIGGERGNGDPPLFADIAALLDGGLPDPPAPKVLGRTDGHCLFYAGQVNVLFGEPESAKTLIGQAASAEVLLSGRRALFIDIDHNGPEATVYRFLDFGVPEEILRDPNLFRYVEPEDKLHMRAIVESAKLWRPAISMVDSIGELLPLFGLSSNSPDDFTIAHTAVLKPLAMAGAAVIAIDHLPKNAENRGKGPTGTAAKRRTIGGVSIRVTVEEQFVPGRGGSAWLTIDKDRHGGLRKNCPPAEGRGEQPAGLFKLDSSESYNLTWSVVAPNLGDAPRDQRASDDDLDALDKLDPPPSSVRDVKERLRWRSDRATNVLRIWRSRRSPSVPGEHGNATVESPAESVPLFPPYVSGNGEQP